MGIQFKVVTDCNAIRTTLTRRDLVPRIGRWWLAIQEYKFDVEYRAGHKMCRFLLEVLRKSPTDHEEREIHKNFVESNKRLYRRTDNGKKWVVPIDARRQVVSHFHDDRGHLSMDKTMAAISGLYWFSGMRRYLKKYISCCLPCLYNKEPGGKEPGYLHPIEKVAVPFDTLHVDHLGPFVKSKRKNTYLIVIVDAFTKFVFMKAVPSSKTGPLLNFLDTVIENFGVPRRIISDRGSCYTSKKFEAYCRNMNIKHVLNATATPRANGQVERYNRTILASLSASTDDEERWDMAVSRVRWGLNSTKNSSTEKSPYELLFGYEPRGVAESVLSNEIATEPIEERDLSAIRKQAKKVIDAKQGERKSKFDAHRYAGYEYKEGDQVMVRTQQTSNQGQSRKLLPKYSGPYVITNVLDHDRYVVKDVEGSSRSQRRYSGIVSLDKLKAFNVEVSSESDVESDTNEIEA
ncbi:Integrase core domain [Popillia japonica]|uniref:RNA-directed DNA polymerase n=1 Tax=Popillia japonica TaxID=7064 RepID=A0AAW1HRL8_POPJA